MTTDAPKVRLELESRPECLTLVRGALIGIGEALAFEPELLDDLKTAVSEACNNVVLHAYAGSPGPLSVEVVVRRDRVEAAVHDRGSGIHGVALASESRMGVGLAVISALAERAEFISNPGEGTKVRMAFSRDAETGAELSHQMSINGTAPPTGLDGSVVAYLSPPAMVTGVLGRLARGLAASAHFSVDRFSDLYLLADRLAEHVRASATGDQVSLQLSAGARRLDLTIGPFRDGTCSGLEAQLGVLADKLSIDHDGEVETVRLVVFDQRRDAGDRS